MSGSKLTTEHSVIGSPGVLRIDESTFPVVVREYAMSVLRFARQRVGSEAAEEIVSDTFADAWRRRDRFNEGEGDNVHAWLLGIATFSIARHRRAERRWLQMCADTARRQAADSRLQVDSSDWDDRVVASERLAELAEGLLKLTADERAPLLLYAYGSLSYEEIATALDVPIGTVRSRISRARRRLQIAAERNES